MHTSQRVTLVIEAFDLHDKTFSWKEEHKVTLGANRSTELWQGRVPGQEIRTKLSQAPRTIIISARILSQYGKVLARYANWYVQFQCPFHLRSFSDVTMKARTIQVHPLPVCRGYGSPNQGDNSPYNT